jgi:predicted metal-dependent enzyme (double-stranded beta helix superfamily)
MLNHFYNSIEKILSNDEVLSEQLKKLRNLLAINLESNDFRIHCVSNIIDTMEDYKLHNKIWDAPHFYYDDELKYSIRMIFWPAFYENNPHQHKTWSVTGVFHHALRIRTYELLNQNRLKIDRNINAVSGEVGYLLPGCIHNVCNPTHEISASIHIFNNIDINNPEENAVWYPAPRKFNLANGLTERALIACLALLENIEDKNVQKIRERIFDIAPISIKFLSVASMYKFDRIHAKKYLTHLEGIM